MITEPKLPIERKGFDVFEVRNFLHIVMLAEPGWVIPAGRYERRYAAISVSTAKRGDRAYFKASIARSTISMKTKSARSARSTVATPATAGPSRH
jgi:hypothetical protein